MGATIEELGPADVAALGARVADNVAAAVKVPDAVLREVLIALLAGGHVLIEDHPGVGKTALARALSRSIDADDARIQCTSDLLPSDLVGANVYNQPAAAFEFRPGPLFANVVLVDEINRASPKTQSGLLECDAGAPRDGRRHQPPAGPAVHGAGDAEPDRLRGHLPAARGAARPLHGPRLARLPLGRRRRRRCSHAHAAGDRVLELAAGELGRGGRARRRRPRARSTPARRCASYVVAVLGAHARGPRAPSSAPARVRG